MMENFHFGQLIHDELKAQGRSITWFSEAIHCDRSNVYKIFRHSHLDTTLLFRISRALNHNFMQDAADYLKKNGIDNSQTKTPENL